MVNVPSPWSEEEASISIKAMQRTASQLAVHLVSVCHPPFHCVASHRGLAVADLVLDRIFYSSTLAVALSI
jgi:hypothetical protein